MWPSSLTPTFSISMFSSIRMSLLQSVLGAWYVALAETLNSDMVTLDGRLAGAPGPMCTFITPY